MWIYDYRLKDDSNKIFYTDEPYFPEEALEFNKKHKDEIEDNFSLHFPITTKEFLGERELKDYEVICK